MGCLNRTRIAQALRALYGGTVPAQKIFPFHHLAAIGDVLTRAESTFNFEIKTTGSEELLHWLQDYFTNAANAPDPKFAFNQMAYEKTSGLLGHDEKLTCVIQGKTARIYNLYLKLVLEIQDKPEFPKEFRNAIRKHFDMIEKSLVDVLEKNIGPDQPTDRDLLDQLIMSVSSAE